MYRMRNKNFILDRKYPVYDKLFFIGRCSDRVRIPANLKKLTFSFNHAHRVCEKFLWLDLVSQCDYIPLMGSSLSLSNVRGDLHLLQEAMGSGGEVGIVISGHSGESEVKPLTFI